MPTAQTSTDNDKAMCQHKCTCGPYPSIVISLDDFSLRCCTGSDGNIFGLDWGNTKQNSYHTFAAVSKEIQNACESHGCFHLEVLVNANQKTKQIHDAELEVQGEQIISGSGTLQCSAASDFFPLWNPPRKIASELEDLFAPEKIKDSTKSSCRSLYRGRCAESGSSVALQSEPKQSWEFKRCRRAKIIHAAATENVGNRNKCTSNSVDLTLQQCTNVLHEVAKLLEKLMNLPHSTAGEQLIVSRCCDCGSNSSEHNMSRVGEEENDSLCNQDLLRLFRYDAVNGGCGDNILLGDKNFSLGSSPHTDWGTLTIVWQDEVGGLEVYCHVHEKWNPVRASVQNKPSSPTSLCDNDKTSNVISLFVHVGDFLSLSRGVVTENPTDASSSSASDIPSTRVSQLKWPSPLHRVVSPKEEIRYSLVYFLYPHNELTLEKAEKLFLQQGGHTDAGSCPTFQPCRQEELLRTYYVLQDQSSASLLSQQKSSLQALEKMLKIPFASEIIASKWNQVQR